ncbi:MAG: hypothetical protein LUD48_01305 [Prevotella sp.]|nr:hypothetical protein [Prevotella sp.]
MKSVNWIAFEIGTRTLKSAVLQENGMPDVKICDFESMSDLYYSENANLDEGLLSFLRKSIETYEARNVAFSIPPGVELSFLHSLYDAVREKVSGDIRFVESPVAVISLYQYLTDAVINGGSLVIDFGYSNSYIAFQDFDTEGYEYSIFRGIGVKSLDKELLAFIKEKFGSRIFKQWDAMTVRESLSYSSVAQLSLEDGTLGNVDRNEFNEIFNNTIELQNQISGFNGFKWIFLVGGGSLIPRFTENVMTFLKENNIQNIRIIRGLKTDIGDFHCQTASLLGTLCIVESLCNQNIQYATVVKKLCTNPYCRSLLSSGDDVCPNCRVDLKAKDFYMCSECKTVVEKEYKDSNNNFCCNCGKHKIQLIKTI